MEAKELVRQVKLLLRASCFELGKWHSSSKQIRFKGRKEVSRGPGEQRAGAADLLGYQWRGREAKLIPTKRGIVADLAQVFDPLGLVGQLCSEIMVQHLTKAIIKVDRKSVRRI